LARTTGGLTVKFYVNGSYKGAATSTSWGQNVDFSYNIPESDAGKTQTWYAKFEGNSEYNASQSHPKTNDSVFTRLQGNKNDN